MGAHKALFDFIELHELKKEPTGNCFFDSIVDYESSKNNIVVATEARFIRNGIEDGKVQLMENGELSVENYHLDFTPTWQTYTFNKATGKLIISGNSPKMGGDYKVTIYPNS